MLNKILSKKIKFPLSLRGEKRRSNLKGFSLIELMIAITILALAIFGIFYAYSAGFMGMADARDRTVATNYLREMIEDFKNMNFNKVKDEPITLIPGTKYHRGSIVLDLEKIGEVVTLKKVITQVRWMDRKGNIKIEEASTILYNKPNISEVSGAAGIILYASHYYAIIPAAEVVLFAEIKDNYGNTITDWEGHISFSFIIPTPNDDYNPVGYINDASRTKDDSDNISVYTNNGKASITFYSFMVGENVSVDGIEMIQASATLLDVAVTDTVNIRVTTGAVGIILEPATEEDRILPVGENSTINVTVVKADYQTLIAYSGTITLNVSDPNIGSLSPSTINSVSTDPANLTTLILTSSGMAGIAEITASAPDLDMGYTEITFTGAPKSIIVSSNKKSIYPDEETTITVTIVDENNKPVAFGASSDSKNVTLSASPDYGIFDDNSNPINLTFEGESSINCVFKASPTGEFPQEITITANDSIGELNTGSTEIEILSPLVAHHIFVTYDSIVELDIEGEQEFSQIDATMQDEYDNETVFGNSIIFETDFGTFLSSGTNFTTLTGGMATAYLYPPSDISTTIEATINIYSNELTPNPEGPLGNPSNPVIIQVLFHLKSAPHHINLTASPQNIFIGEDTCTLTAKVVDESGVTYSDYIGQVRFNITDTAGSVNHDALDVDASNGIATLDLTSTNNSGTIHVTAKTLDLDPNVSTILSTPVYIGEIELELVKDSIIYYDNGKIVMFNINIIGPELNLKDMKIEWVYDPSKLSKIEIKSPDTVADYNPIIDTGNAKTPYTEYDINTNLLPDESTIRLTFSASMKGKPLSVTFDTNFGTYIYTETIPIVVE